MPILDTTKFKVESKWHCFKRKAAEKGRAFVQYVGDHKEAIALITPAVVGIIGAGKRLTRNVARHRVIMEERELKDYRVYDRRIGAYLRLRRPLNNSDWKKITPRLNKGEKLANILQSMDMLR